MAITFVNAGTVSSGTGNLTPTLPASLNDDDFALLVVHNDGADTFSTPANWTVLTSMTTATRSFLSCGFLTSGQSSSTVTVTHTGSNFSIANMVVYRGVEKNNPIRQMSAWPKTATDANVFGKSIAPVNNDWVVFIGGLNDNGTFSGYTGTNPTFTERFDHAGGGSNFASIFAADGTSDGSSTGERTATCTGTGSSGGYLVALVPDAAEPDPPAGVWIVPIP